MAHGLNPAKFFAFLFPYRTHLEAEVEYLRAQLAQKQRRIDEGDQRWKDFTALNRKEPRGTPPGLHPVKARGWDAYRAQQKEEPIDEAGTKEVAAQPAKESA